MQKVAVPDIEDAVRPEPVKRELPDLDDELLSPEGPERGDSTEAPAEGPTNTPSPPEDQEFSAVPQDKG